MGLGGFVVGGWGDVGWKERGRERGWGGVEHWIEGGVVRAGGVGVLESRGGDRIQDCVHISNLKSSGWERVGKGLDK